MSAPSRRCLKIAEASCGGAVMLLINLEADETPPELLGKTLDVPFKSCAEILFCDTAIAVQVPYEAPDMPMASHTISTAQSAGWTWDIGLPHRRGTGYVYSSRHISDDDAVDELMRYVGPMGNGLTPRKIPIRSGHRETF